MKTIAIIAQKGGTGKTTTAQATAAGLARKGYKVLLADMDAQSNLTYAAGLDGQHRAGMYELLTQAATAREVIQEAPPVSFIAASSALATLDLTLTQAGRENRLKAALGPVAVQYDYCIIDTPPALGILTINALTAAGSAIITAQADIFSLQAIGALTATLEAIRKHANPALKIAGILITRHNPRTVLSRDIMNMMQDTAAQLSTKVYSSYIRENTAIKEAQAMQTDIFSYSPYCNAALDYESFINELTEGA